MIQSSQLSKKKSELPNGRVEQNQFTVNDTRVSTSNTSSNNTRSKNTSSNNTGSNKQDKNYGITPSKRPG